MRRKPANPPKSPDAIDAAVGRNVRAWRLKKGLSQSQLAKRLGVTFQQVQKYEKGTNRIGSGRIARIATILGVPITTLFPDETAGAEAELARLKLLGTRASLRLAEAFNTITDEILRLSIVSLVEEVATATPRRSHPGRTARPHKG